MIAGVVGATWVIAFSFVSEHWDSLLQFAVVFVGMLIFGAIAWPDDFKRNPPTKRDGRRRPERVASELQSQLLVGRALEREAVQR